MAGGPTPRPRNSRSRGERKEGPEDSLGDGSSSIARAMPPPLPSRALLRRLTLLAALGLVGGWAGGCADGDEGGVTPVSSGGADSGGSQVGDGFGLALFPEVLSVRHGDTDTVQIRVRRRGAFSGTVYLRAEDLPRDVTVLLEPVFVVGDSAVVIVSVGDRTPLGDARFVVAGEGSGVPDGRVELVLTTFGAGPGSGGP